ncbi:MAG TPA: hypothetical protein DCX79_02055, partial [Planctomycetaceae bacterium]|nr:hypothetical protein [Planctomycetaceae bacterium]
MLDSTTVLVTGEFGRTPDDLAATFYQAMGIDPGMEFQANTGRPITL